MKKRLIKIYLILMSVFFLVSSCKKDITYKSSGKIVGLNNGFCVTCGGFYLNLSQDTVVTPATYYVLQYAPSYTVVITTLYEQYNKDQRPISVLLNWQPLMDSINGHQSLNVTAVTKK